MLFALPRQIRLSMQLLLSCIAISAFSLPLHAEESSREQSILKHIHQVIINSYYSVNGFYNFSANQADKEQKSILNESIASIDELMAELSNQLTDQANSDTFKSANNSWKSYKKVLKLNVSEVDSTGYPDLRLAGDMAESNIVFNDVMRSLYLAISEVEQASELTETSRNSARILALMMTKYSARTTSTVSQVYSGGDAEITIDALATQFEALLGKLQDLSDGNAAAEAALDSAKTKWDFIKSSYINYNENRVNYIVNLYTKKIISDIESINQQ